MNVLDRFLTYVAYWTTSDDASLESPSTARQKTLGHLLVDEMQALGLQDVTMDAAGNVIGTLPATCASAPVLALIAHMDTADDASGENVNPQIHPNYDGGKVVLPATGAVLDRPLLERLRDVFVENDLIVISDEIYSELTYTEEGHTSIASLPGMHERTIVLNGFSKAFAMTGWRMGYLCAPAAFTDVMCKIHQYTILCAPRQGQVAAEEALRQGREDGYADVVSMRESYNQRRRLMVESFRDMGLSCFEPLGAFYVFPGIQKTGLSSEDFCQRLLREKKVVTCLRRQRRRLHSLQLCHRHCQAHRGARPHGGLCGVPVIPF